MKALFGWTVIARRSARCGFFVYKRDRPADAANHAADLAPFTFETEAEAKRQGALKNYAYDYSEGSAYMKQLSLPNG